MELREDGSRASRPPLSSVVKVRRPFGSGVAVAAVDADTGGSRAARCVRWPCIAASRSPARTETPPSRPYSERYRFAEAHANRRESALALAFEVVAGAGEVVGVVVQVLVDGAPEAGVPVALVAEVAIVRELEDRAVRVGLEVEAEGHVEVAGAEVEAADIAAARRVAQQRIEDVVQVDVEVVVLEGPARAVRALHVVDRAVIPSRRTSRP